MTLSRVSTLFRYVADSGLSLFARLAAATATLALVGIVVFLAFSAWPALSQIPVWRFVTDESWHPLSNQYSLVPMLAGTILSTLGALLLAIPMGFAAAAFVVFYAPSGWAAVYQRVLELLAGIPSVVFGLWGLMVLVPTFAAWGGSGQGLLTASLVLSLMLIPTLALTSAAALRSVPSRMVMGGSALGLSRWSIVSRIAIPHAWPGIAAGLVLATARGVGETMAVLMVAGNVPTWPDSLTAPIRTLTTNMALEMGYATAAHRSILFVSGLLLVVVVISAVAFSERWGGTHET